MIEKPINLKATSMIFDNFDKNKFVPKKVIEFGCGYGRNLRGAFDRYKCEFFGFDIDIDIINACKNSFSEVTCGFFEVADLCDISFYKKYKDKEFDLGIVSGFLMFVKVEMKKEIIEEMKRICKYLLVAEPSSIDVQHFIVDSTGINKEYNFDNYLQYGLVKIADQIRVSGCYLTLYLGTNL